MHSIVVYNKKDLKDAIEQGAKKITIRGDFAEKFEVAFRIKSASKWSIKLLSVALVGIPFTAGISAVAVAPIALLTGIEVVAIIAVASIGITHVLLVCRDYKRVKFTGKSKDMEAELELEREETAAA